MAEAIDSGKAAFRGTLLFELQAASVALAKTLLSCEEITQEECGVSNFYVLFFTFFFVN